MWHNAPTAIFSCGNLKKTLQETFMHTVAHVQALHQECRIIAEEILSCRIGKFHHFLQNNFCERYEQRDATLLHYKIPSRTKHERIQQGLGGKRTDDKERFHIFTNEASKNVLQRPSCAI
jgi:hypothetical protein